MSGCCASSCKPTMPPIALASCAAIHPSARVVTSRKLSPSSPATAFTGLNAGCISVRPFDNAPSISPFQKMAGFPSLSAASANSLSSAIPTSLALNFKCAAKCLSAAANNSLRSPAFAPGSTRKAKPCKDPMSSPSTSTRLSAPISTGKSPTSAAPLRKSIEVRLSTNRWRSASCSASDNFSSSARARSAIIAGLESQSPRCAM